MDVDMQRLIQAEPFLGYLGLEVVEARPGMAVLRLRLRRDVAIHIGTVHGGAQYGLGEAPAIALAATLFPEHVERLNLLTANARITYHAWLAAISPRVQSYRMTPANAFAPSLPSGDACASRSPSR